MRALFPHDATRRRFLRAVGANTALAAVAQFFPLAAAREAFAQGKGQIEKPNLKVGFIPITCAHADHHVAADGLLRPRRASTSTS